MMKQEIIHIKSIKEYFHFIGAKGLKHPLLAIYPFQDFPNMRVEKSTKFTLGFYTISLKIDYACKTQYGQTNYDFDEGLMGFTAPHQVAAIDKNFISPDNGWLLMLHPDFLFNYPLAKKIREYSFFEYAVNEALILSEDEEKSLKELFSNIQKEYNLAIDEFSQDVLVSQIDLLLTLCNRYYSRQFITRKKSNSDMLSKFEALLHANFFSGLHKEIANLSVRYFAAELNVSPNYLSDVLRNVTGQNAQQHIHDKVIEKAKELLASTHLSINEISYLLGFEYSQSFSKLFKSKTSLTPLEFRSSFN